MPQKDFCNTICQNLKSRVHFVGIGTGKKRPASRPTFRFTPARGGRAGADEVRRKSERERAEYAREGEVLIDSETPEDTEDRAAQLRAGAREAAAADTVRRQLR